MKRTIGTETSGIDTTGLDPLTQRMDRIFTNVKKDIVQKPRLRHVPNTERHDASGPNIEINVRPHRFDKATYLNSIQKGTRLKHVTHMKDRSNPMIDRNMHLKRFNRNQLLHEIEQGTDLRHITS
eukprot:gb/GECH01011200.1/.p1 GENE.gb/GECH01011200.1/~~gb/GECH01011200.1/.p1  ORF type:complete len:125 (+),score=28.66 gb/GECH01011200.1/:1-375(+)